MQNYDYIYLAPVETGEPDRLTRETAPDVLIQLAPNTVEEEEGGRPARSLEDRSHRSPDPPRFVLVQLG